MAATEASAKTSLESLTTRYRRELQRGGPAHLELEVRLLDVDFASFAAVHAALVASGAPGHVTQMVGAINDVRAARGASGAAPRTQRPMRIREVFFEGGLKAGEHYTYKEPLLAPYRGPGYIVALASERTEEKGGFSASEDTVIRVKARVSFQLALPAAGDGASDGDSGAARAREIRWRIDMTVTRQLTGSSVTALPQIRDQMFKGAPPMTAETFLESLRLTAGDAQAATLQALYRFEIEAEFVGEGAERDALRPPDIAGVADRLLTLANPGHEQSAALQAEVYFLATHILKREAAERFRKDLGLKRLLPQAIAMTRGDYREIYPPVGLALTDKADGRRAVAIVRSDKSCIVSDTLIDFTPGGLAESKRAPAAPAAAAAKTPAAAAAKTPAAAAAKTPATAAAAAAKSSAAAAAVAMATLPPATSFSTAAVRMAPAKAAVPLTIADGEYVVDAGKPVFYVFDLIYVNGDSVVEAPFEARAPRIAEAVAALRAGGIPAAVKPYHTLAGTTRAALEKEIRGVLEAKRPYEIDGLVFVAPGRGYLDTVHRKYKTAAHNTIDFLARRPPAVVLGKYPYIDRPGHKLYYLFVGINGELHEALGLQWCPGYAALFAADAAARRENYFPIQFSPSDTPYAYLYQHPDDAPVGAIDGQIVELRCRVQDGVAAALAPLAGAGAGAQFEGPAVATPDWELVRVRDDRARDLLTKRYFGNDFRTAELVWLNYLDPFPVEQLWEGPTSDYFQESKLEMYRAMTAVISYVKTQRINMLHHAKWVVDLAAGKGQDLFRYLDAQVGHLVAVDSDRAALAELVRRKYSFARRERGAGRGDRGAAARRAAAQMTVHVVVADLTAPHLETLKRIEVYGLPRGTADAAVCNLAVHYFMGDIATLRNFIALARALVRVGGVVVITAMIGEEIHKLLAAGRVGFNESWDVHEGEALKYSLKRLYASETLEPLGQKIGVLLPFSNGRYYEEYLVNTRTLIDEFARRDFKVVAVANIASSIPQFKAGSPRIAAQLTADDRAYLGLFAEIVFRRER
jgi:SAM-dependent methyltransferase